MKNILIISYIYPPYNAPAARRPYSWAKYLDKTKYNVTVLTCSNPDSSLGVDDTMNNELPHVKLIGIKSKLNNNLGAGFRNAKMQAGSPGIKSKLKSKIVQLGTYFLIPDKAIFWYANAKKYLKQNNDFVSNLDIVISTSPSMTNHLLGMYLKQLQPKLKLIGDLRDYHYIEGQQLHSPWPLSLFHKRFERNILHKADKITFISNAMREIYANHYKKDSAKFSVIYNGFDQDDFSVEKTLIKEKSSKIRIFYAGSFYGGVRSPKGLLQLIDWAVEDKLMTLDDVEVVIAGNFEKSLQEEMAIFKSYKTVNYIGKIPRNEVIKQYEQSTILWLIVGEQISHYTGVPLKFYEYLAANRFIMNFAPNKSEPTALIKKYDLGANVDIHNDTKEEQLKVWGIMISKWQLDGLNVAPQDDVLSIFDRKNQTTLLEKLIDLD
ncbi:glycosyltransferase [Dokdonia sp. Asnod3-C12]|uniref:glycosyltransferase n=1 Tax=Dokdonia sp. Asnod3-C12 TaxID=3160575 RepID=UPI00386AC636